MPANSTSKVMRPCPMCGRESPLGSPACPACGEPLAGAADLDEEGIWRWGKVLVMSRHARLPNRCVKSNEPTQLRLKRSLSWHHPAIFLGLCAGLLIYVILALVLRKTATIEVGLSKLWFSRRRWAIALGWLFALSSICLIVLGVQLHRTEYRSLVVVAGILGALASLVLANIRAAIVTPYKITDDYIFVKGVHRDYLETLPEWSAG